MKETGGDKLYKVKTNLFEGPFDLLVYLIENAQMSIYDIKIAEITEQYIFRIQQMQERNIDVASEFLVLAATLIEIKSRMLLPRHEEYSQESLMIDPRKELVARLEEYKKFKSAAGLLQVREEVYLNVFYKPQEDVTPYSQEDMEYIDMDLSQFVKAFHLFITKKKRLEDIRKNYDSSTRVERVSVEEKVDLIKNKVSRCNQITFGGLMEECEDKNEVVITFMAVLNMMRTGEIQVEQTINFGEITIWEVKND